LRPQVEHDRGGERLAGARLVAGVVELLGGLGVGVGVEQVVEQLDRVGVALLARRGAGSGW
jgi:hypothetical protein